MIVMPMPKGAPIIIPGAPHFSSPGNSCHADVSEITVVIIFVAIFYFVSFMVGFLEAYVETGPETHYFDNYIKKIFFTFAVGLYVGRVLFKKRGKQ